MTDIDVAIVGGGISGLSAARALCRQGLIVRLFEREAACGGVIRTESVGGFVIDSGPDTLLSHKPSAIELVRELGLDANLVQPLPRRTTYVLRGSALRTLPETSALGLPTGWRTVVGARAFSWMGKLRMAAETFIPGSPPSTDESIATFVRRRFGREAVTYVAEPVLAGLHRGDAARLSMRALFPFLAEAERRHGSVAAAWRRMPASARHGGSMSLRGGLGQIAARLQADLPAGVTVTAAEVIAIERDTGFAIRLQGGASVSTRAVILATPAHVTSTLITSLDPELSRLCGSINYAPSINVALGYRREAIRHPLQGWGFMVPARERRLLRSVSWMSSKWPDRAPPGHALIRASIGNATDAVVLEQHDRTLIERAHKDLRELLDIVEVPILARVYRRPRAMPQLEVGHLDRVSAIDRRLASVPGLFVSASGFRGIGLPDCISDARSVAQRAAAYVHEVADPIAV
jgi:oxygen-dependent protoporphyrinogen oxidase